MLRICAYALVLGLAGLAISAALADPPDDAFAGPQWRDTATAMDADRLERADLTFGTVMRDAIGPAAPEALSELATLLRTPTRDFEHNELVGVWRCRLIKIRTEAPTITIGGWDECDAEPGEHALFFSKLTGRERFNGNLWPEASDRMVYVGAFHYDNERVRPYSTVDSINEPTNGNQIGWVTMRGDRVVIELPAPEFRTAYDILEMAKK